MNLASPKYMHLFEAAKTQSHRCLLLPTKRCQTPRIERRRDGGLLRIKSLPFYGAMCSRTESNDADWTQNPNKNPTWSWSFDIFDQANLSAIVSAFRGVNACDVPLYVFVSEENESLANFVSLFVISQRFALFKTASKPLKTI